MTESTGRTSSPEYINLRNMMQRLLKIYSSLNNEYLILIAQRSYENKRKTTTTEEMLIFHHKMRFSELINSKSALQTDCLSEQNKVCSSFIFLYKKKEKRWDKSISYKSAVQPSCSRKRDGGHGPVSPVSGDVLLPCEFAASAISAFARANFSSRSRCAAVIHSGATVSRASLASSKPVCLINQKCISDVL